MSAGLPKTAIITRSRPLTVDTTLYTLSCNDRNAPLSSFLPGQFLELSLPGIGEVPISYCGLPGDSGAIELCIRHLGHVTLALQRALPGDQVGLRGPFGQGFPLVSYENRDLLLIAGGLGMAPLRSLLLALLAQRERWGELILLYGAREAGSLLFLDELLELLQRSDIRIHLAIDRPGGSPDVPPNCRVALLPALLDQLTIHPDRTSAALCGPPAVYPYLVTGLKKMGLSDDRIHLSLERRMKCGLGRCGHCAVGTLLCCTDGPVFSLARLQGIEGALA
jgi:sulfhydrogenase subunit gamma (sulfur reductase)